MPPTSSKNYALSAAGADLGLGDLVTQQLQDQEEERKKKLLQMQGIGQGPGGVFGPAAASLGIGLTG